MKQLLDSFLPYISAGGVLTSLGILLYNLFVTKGLGKYFEEKGKNIATKEDIGEITKIVESIKGELSKELENHKAVLSLKNQNRFSLQSAQREALIDYNKKVAAYMYAVLHVGMWKFTTENYHEIDNEIKDSYERKYQAELSEAHLKLFAEDVGLSETINLLSKEISKLFWFNHSHFQQLKHEFLLYEIQLKRTEIDVSAVIESLYENREKIREELYQKQQEQTPIILQNYFNLSNLIKLNLKESF